MPLKPVVERLVSRLELNVVIIKPNPDVPLYEGYSKTIYVTSDYRLNILHECAHFIAATPKQRRLDNWGMGDTRTQKPTFALTKSEILFREALACWFSYYMVRTLGGARLEYTLYLNTFNLIYSDYPYLTRLNHKTRRRRLRRFYRPEWVLDVHNTNKVV